MIASEPLHSPSDWLWSLCTPGISIPVILAIPSHHRLSELVAVADVLAFYPFVLLSRALLNSPFRHAYTEPFQPCEVWPDETNNAAFMPASQPLLLSALALLSDAFKSIESSHVR
jgi:hypothetical protein